MKKIILFGAGKIGQGAKLLLEREGKEIAYFVDNDPEKWNTQIMNVPVINFEAFKENAALYDLIITLNKRNMQQVIKQIKQEKIYDYEVFDEKRLLERERVISYSHPYDMEDIVLYHVLYGEKELFYIDIGSCDPLRNSVTKLLYDTKGAHGINVEPQKSLIRITNRERIRDINLCVGVGDKCEKRTLYFQGGRSTLVQDNIISPNCRSEEINIVTLAQICEKYIHKEQKISFLKVDVEGYEKQVLEGADFDTYRPSIVLVESEEPGSLRPNYDEWESILLQKNYHYVFTSGVNRYYVADERTDLDKKFLDVDTLKRMYRIFHADFTELE